MKQQKWAGLLAILALLVSTFTDAGPTRPAADPTEAGDSDAPYVIAEEHLDDIEDQPDTQSMIDRAYELGYEARWDGTIDFAHGIQNANGDEIHGLIDGDAMIGVDKALEDGHISEREHDEFTAMAKEVEDRQDSDSVTPMAVVSCGSSLAVYRWRFNGNIVQCFSNGGGAASPTYQPWTGHCIKGGAAGYRGVTYLKNVSSGAYGWSNAIHSGSSTWTCRDGNTFFHAFEARVSRIR